MKTVLVTGAAGFIGYHVSQRLLARGDRVVGVDNLSDYYDVTLKRARLARLSPAAEFSFEQIDLADRNAAGQLFGSTQCDAIVHLAAQAGVRYSIDHPHADVDSNLVGFLNVLEGARQRRVEHLVYASSSSVYGANQRMPFAESHHADHPLSLYAATKRANELMAHSYSALYALPTTGLRLFTVYGPWGRPDMAIWRFTEAILRGEPIDLYNEGRMRRDFTFVEDVAEGIVRTLDRPAAGDPAWAAHAPDPSTSVAPYRVYNIGCHEPVELLRVVETLERLLGTVAKRRLLPMQPGDVPATYADVERLATATGFRPSTTIEAGLKKYVAWHREYAATR